jgi:hypothetical protein
MFIKLKKSMHLAHRHFSILAGVRNTPRGQGGARMEDFESESHFPQRLDRTEGVICLEGLVFLEKSIIKADDPIVKKTFQDIYKYVSYN